MPNVSVVSKLATAVRYDGGKFGQVLIRPGANTVSTDALNALQDNVAFNTHVKLKHILINAAGPSSVTTVKPAAPVTPTPPKPAPVTPTPPKPAPVTPTPPKPAPAAPATPDPAQAFLTAFDTMSEPEQAALYGVADPEQKALIDAHRASQAKA